MSLFFSLFFALLRTADAQNRLPDQVRSRYFAFRHGEAIPNAQKRICTSREAGIRRENGLTEKGKSQAESSARAWAQTLVAESTAAPIVILASPFSRTRETAEILRSALRASRKSPVDLRVEDALRERYFGDHEGKRSSEELWNRISARDQENPLQASENVEPVDQVETRVTRLIRELESRPSTRSSPTIYVLVSHSETLAILQNAFAARKTADYAKLPGLKTAEIQELKKAKP